MSTGMQDLIRLNAADRQRALRALRGRLFGGDGGAVGPQRATRGKASPLSFFQEQLWFIDALAPGRSTYNIPVPYRLRGQLDVNAFRAALTQVVARHESLRTTFGMRDQEPVQVVQAPGPVEVPLHDLTAVVPEERTDELARRLRAAAREPFDLRRGPLLRPQLYRLSEDEHVFLWMTHHIVFDGWSHDVLLRELDAGYRRLRGEHVPELPEVPLQYADYAIWQRQRLTGERLERLVGYWREQLDGIEICQLPTDHPRPARMTFEGVDATRLLSRGLLDDLRGVAERGGVTLFSVLLAAYAALLHRYTGQRDLAIGTVHASRTHAELEDVIGYLVNVLVLRLRVHPEERFAALAEAARQVVLEAQDHQELPFSKLVEELNPPRDPSRTPFFQTSFVLQNDTGRVRTIGDVAVEAERTEVGESRFDLGVRAIEQDDGILLIAEYNTNLFEPATIDRLLEHYEILCRGIVDDPERAIGTLPVMREAERHRLLVEWNHTERPIRELSLVEAFTEVALRQPDHLAVRGLDAELTYGQLAGRAEALAAMLAAAGARHGDRVGVLCHRTTAMVVAELAILRAGCTFVPIDTAFPEPRVRWLLDHAGCRAVVGHRDLLDGLAGAGRALLDVDDATASAPPCRTAPGPHDAAYVMYTSGSTGAPKGAVIDHVSVVNFADTVRDRFGLTPDDRVLQFASLSFDVAVFEIFGALLAGASLHVATEEDRRSCNRLQTFLADQEITVMDLPPAVIEQLDAVRLPHERLAFVGGEPFSGDIVNAWNRDGRQLFNGYGPTECTVTTVMKDCQGHWNRSPFIGQPTPNHRVYVLDDRGQPVPTGVVGELYISGIGLAREYLDAPELTAERFVPNPFAGPPFTRMYRTGDLVRWRNSGDLEFVGRRDHQVKIRGVRIEPGEVEAALGAHPQVAQCVVHAQPDAQGHPQLIGYVVCEPGPTPPETELRTFLSRTLPPAMVPSRFLTLEELPVNTSGKIDRKRLPPPGGDRPGLDERYVEPRDATERTVAEQIFQPVLSINRVGVFDSFFDLGGSSLQLVQVVSRTADLFGVDLDVADFFQAPTVADLADCVIRLQAERIANQDDLLSALEEIEEGSEVCE